MFLKFLLVMCIFVQLLWYHAIICLFTRKSEACTIKLRQGQALDQFGSPARTPKLCEWSMLLQLSKTTPWIACVRVILIEFRALNFMPIFRVVGPRPMPRKNRGRWSKCLKNTTSNRFVCKKKQLYCQKIKFEIFLKFHGSLSYLLSLRPCLWSCFRCLMLSEQPIASSSYGS